VCIRDGNNQSRKRPTATNRIENAMTNDPTSDSHSPELENVLSETQRTHGTLTKLLAGVPGLLNKPQKANKKRRCASGLATYCVELWQHLQEQLRILKEKFSHLADHWQYLLAQGELRNAFVTLYETLALIMEAVEDAVKAKDFKQRAASLRASDALRVSIALELGVALGIPAEYVQALAAS
jgi:hypothetical protein